MTGSREIPMFVENERRPFQTIPFSMTRVNQGSVNLTTTSPTRESMTGPKSDQEFVANQESGRIGKTRYSKEHKEAILGWSENGHDTTSIAEKFCKEFPDGRKLTPAMVASCLNRWRRKGTGAVEEKSEDCIQAISSSVGMQSKPYLVIPRECVPS